MIPVTYKILLEHYEEAKDVNTEVLEKLIKQSKKGKFKDISLFDNFLSLENLNRLLEKNEPQV